MRIFYLAFKISESREFSDVWFLGRVHIGRNLYRFIDEGFGAYRGENRCYYRRVWCTCIGGLGGLCSDMEKFP